jgi:hypothetical protein
MAVQTSPGLSGGETTSSPSIQSWRDCHVVVVSAIAGLGRHFQRLPAVALALQEGSLAASMAPLQYLLVHLVPSSLFPMSGWSTLVLSTMSYLQVGSIVGTIPKPQGYP